MDEENSDIPNPVAPQQEDKEQLEDAIVALRQEKARTKLFLPTQGVGC